MNYHLKLPMNEQLIGDDEHIQDVDERCQRISNHSTCKFAFEFAYDDLDLNRILTLELEFPFEMNK